MYYSMKALKFLILGLLVANIAVYSCKDDNATCTDGIQNQDETGVDCGGVCTACPTCNDGIQNGDETGVDCGGSACPACKVGAQGTWKSYPVAPILAAYADSIIATFNTNNTYSVAQWKSGAKVTLTGTYTQTKSSVGNIYTILLNQTTPTVLTAEGMFEVTNNDTKMTYEIVQTTPAIGAAPPTPAAGFGSSTYNGTALGAVNIQYYTRVN